MNNISLHFFVIGQKGQLFHYFSNCNPPPSRLNTYNTQRHRGPNYFKPIYRTKHYKWAVHHMISRKTNFKFHEFLTSNFFRVETITNMYTNMNLLVKKFEKIRNFFFVKKCDEQLKSFYHRLDAHCCDLRKVDSLLIDPASPSSSE